MKWNTDSVVLPNSFLETQVENPSAQFYNILLHSVRLPIMSLGVHLGSKDSVRNSATWPKMKKSLANKTEDMDRFHPRPQTATLERPRILDIALLGKIDMTLTRKGLLSISNLCLAPIQKGDPRETKRNGSSIRDGRGGKTRKYQLTRKKTTDVEKIKNQKELSKKSDDKADERWEDEENSVASEVSKTKKTSKLIAKIPVLVKQKRSPIHNNNNNNENEDDNKSVSRPVIVKKGVGGKRVDEVFGGPKAAVDVPAPCTTCGRPEQPERFHSHPAPSASRPRGTLVEEDSSRKTVKSSVRKPVAIKFRSGKSNRKPDEAVETSSPDMGKKETSPPEAPKKDVSPPEAPKKETTPPQRSGPRTVLCYLCGREFGTASFPLHEPHCLQRWQRENEQLPPKLQRTLPQKPGKPLSTAEWNKFAWEASQSNLVPCVNCGRTFNPDRLEVHQRSCRPDPRKLTLPNKKPAEGEGCDPVSQPQPQPREKSAGKPSPITHCYICGRMFGSASIGIHEPKCLDKWRGENSKLPLNKQRAEPVKPTGQSSILQPAPAPAPAPEPQQQARSSAPKSPRRRMVQCYLCGRQFGTASVNIHEVQCLKKWHIENNKLPRDKRRQEPEKPNIMFTATGDVDYQGTMDAIWKSHLDQLVPCVNCGRTFNPDRLEVHERSCKGPKR